MQRRLLAVLPMAASIGLILAVTAVYHLAVPVNPTTVALSYVVVILLVASRWGAVESMAASVTATVCLNVFFLPPVGTIHVADPQNWIALGAFLLTGIVASQLSSRARERNLEALARQRDLARLYALSRGLLASPGRPSIPAAIARTIADAFDFSPVAVYDYETDSLAWAGPSERPAIEAVLRQVARDGAAVRDRQIRVVPIRVGRTPVGSLAFPDGGLGETVVQAIANLAAIGLERARGVEAAARAEAAQQSGELRATMLDALAHEFKTPLTSMKIAAAHLRAHVTGERNQELAAIVEEDLDRLQSLVSDTVQMVRVDSGDFTLQPDSCRLSEIVAVALRSLESRLDGHSIVTRVPASLSVHADRELLGLALRQLLDNAAKYSPPTSAIEITAEGETTVDIAVRNSGPPIPDREQPRLFDRFYRGSQSRRVPGTGMGLAIARAIAEAHRGALTLSSSAELGTVFTLSLPGEGVRS